MIGNVLEEIFFGALVDQVGPANSNGFNPLAVGSNIPGTSHQPNGGQFEQPPIQQLPIGQAQDQTLQAVRGKVKPYRW